MPLGDNTDLVWE